MPVFRVEKTKDFTVMSNHHLRNQQISLKAKGLLSQILSLPPDWDYSLAGLAAINMEGIDAVRDAVKELEKAGYITRERVRGPDGKLQGSIYVIREEPVTEKPMLENPTQVMPILENPTTGPPAQDKPTELRKEVINTEKQNKDCTEYSSYQIRDGPQEEADKMRLDREAYRELIMENIEYDFLIRDFRDSDEVDELIEIMLDAICSTRSTIVVRGENMPKEVVKSRLLKLNSEHIRYVLDCLHSNTVKARNIKQYLLAALYNAPSTISSYYTNLVNHDLYGGD